MRTAGIRELKQNASAVVVAAQTESVTITDRGRAVARLVPLVESRLQQLLGEGRARPAKARLVDLALPDPCVDIEISLSAAVAEARAMERY
jgi:prevent-host-death family protein